MRILLINHYAGSPAMGMEFRPYYLASEWNKMGHEVAIIAADYSHLRRENPCVEKDFQCEYINNITYCWVKTKPYEGNGAKRAFTMVQFVGKLWLYAKKLARQFKPDVVISSSTYPLDTYAAKKIAKKARAKYVHEVHDMWPSTLYEVGGMSKKNPFVIVMQLAENKAYKQCDKLVALLPNSKEYMVEHGLTPEKFVNIQNGIVEEEWTNPEELPELHRLFFDKHKDKFVVGYFGGHALSNALDNMLDAAKIDKDESTIYVLVGNGIEKDNLMERVRREEIQNVYFLPPVKKRAVPTLVEHFDCTFITGKASPLYRFGLCINKMYDSMMAAKPIVCAIQARDTLVEQYDCGIVVDPSNIEKIVDAIEYIRSLPIEERLKMGHRGKMAVLTNYTYRRLAEQFIIAVSEIQ